MIDLNKPVNFAPINKKLREFFYSDLYCLYAGIILYLVLVFSWLPYFQYRINPDGISYILVAQKIIQGDFIQAVNGYWGIGFPVLIALFLKITPIPILAAKYALILSGGIFLIGISLFINSFLQSTALKRIGLLSASLLIPTFVFEVVTSDLLFAGLFLIYLSYLLLAIQTKTRVSWLSGVLGGLLYLTRENGLYFFFSHFLVFVLFCHFFIQKFNRKDWIKLGSILLVATIMSGIFIGGQYLKYDQINIGSRLQYILSWIRPDSPGLFTFTQGFLPLPSEQSQNIWEDPTFHKIVYWSPFSNLEFIFNNFLINIISFVKIINSFSFALLPLSIIALSWFFYRRDKTILFFFLFTPLLYMGGYLVTYVGSEIRYFWSIIIIMYILVFKLLDKVVFYRGYTKLIVLLAICFSISLLYKPLTNLLRASKANLDSQYVFINSQLQNAGIQNNQIIGSNEYFAESMYISFYSANKYIGQSTKFINSQESVKKETRKWSDLESDFEKFKVNYYLLWGSDENEQELLKQYPYIQLENANVKLFKITDY